MNGFQDTRVRAAAVAALVLLLVAGIYWSYHREKPVETGQATSLEEVDSVFPQGLPFDRDGAILQNFMAGDGRSAQWTQVYLTDEGLEEHKAGYVAYFQENGWTILDETATPPQRATLLAEKDATQLLTAFEIGGGKTVVNVTLMQSPARPITNK